MKKLSLLLTGGLFVVSTFVSANPTLYGKANLSLNKHDAEDATGATTEDNWQLNSNASRLGVKGDLAIEETNLKAVYQLEYEVAVDDGSAQSSSINADCDGTGTVDECGKAESTFKQRNIYVGIEGDFGKVIAGMFDTPFKQAQGKIDLFNDLHLGDIKDVVNGENRMSNILMYSSPEFNQFSAELAFIPGEGSEATDDNGLADATSLSVKYKAESFWIAVASDSELKGYDATRVVAEYSINNTTLGALVQSDEAVAGGEENSSYVVSAQHQINKWVLKGQYASNNEDITDVDTTMFTIGADYKLNKHAKLYAYTSQLEDDAKGDESTFGLGAEVKF